MALQFSPQAEQKIVEICRRYPNTQAACLPVLHLAQDEFGFLSKEAMDLVAHRLSLPAAHVYGVATFYTMFQLKPKGKYLLQVCTTTPCWLRGSEAVMKACQHAADGEIFSVQEVECLGGCVNAPAARRPSCRPACAWKWPVFIAILASFRRAVRWPRRRWPTTRSAS